MPVGAPQRPGIGPWLLSAVAIGIGAQLLRFRACLARAKPQKLCADAYGDRAQEPGPDPWTLRSPDRHPVGLLARLLYSGTDQLTPGQPWMAFPNAEASAGVISTTRRPPPSMGMRSTMPRPSLVTSSGPSPVLGFIAAMGNPFRYLTEVLLIGARAAQDLRCTLSADHYRAFIPP